MRFIDFIKRRMMSAQSGGGGNTITFSVSGYGTYQADSGMTWTQWVNSAYNSEGYEIINEFVFTPEPYREFLVDPNDDYVQEWDTIIADGEYYGG